MGNFNSAIILSNDTSAYYNLAIERLLLKQNIQIPLLFLWQSKNAVVIGAHQNPFAECDLEKMQLNGVELARRMTGGGAVYHDIGNLNFTFITPKPLSDFNANFKMILSALEGFGITSTLSGRNDILANGFKVSGSAYYKTERTELHHGTLLIDSDLSALSSYLTPKKEKLLKNGVKSVASRVTNLKSINGNLTVDFVKNALIDSFKRQNADCETVEITQFLTSNEINEQIEFIKSQEYLYEKWRNFNKKVGKTCEWGYCSVDFCIDASGQIIALQIESDTTFSQVISQIQKTLLNCNLFALPCEWGSNSIEKQIYNSIVELIKERL